MPNSDCNLTDIWSLAVTRPGGASLTNCIHRYEAPQRLIVKDQTGHKIDVGPVVVPAATRWRWLPDDEGFWIRCLNGCCDVKF